MLIHPRLIFEYLGGFLSPHASRHVGDISFTVCLSATIFITHISGVGWHRAMKFGRMVDLGRWAGRIIFGEVWLRG